jgi:CheY-like chemotaxis protein
LRRFTRSFFGLPLNFRDEELRFSVKVVLEVSEMLRSPRSRGPSRNLNLARVLLVHGELAPRLALRTILQAGGYAVDAAATPAEALCKLDEQAYDLVLSEGRFSSGPGGSDLLAYARVKDYRPATAVITSHERTRLDRTRRRGQQISIHTENVTSLLEKVADLIGIRASRRYRPLRQAV